MAITVNPGVVENLIAGRAASSDQHVELRPFGDRTPGHATVADPEQVEQALAAAWRSAGVTARVPAHARAGILEAVSRAIEGQRDRFVELIVGESGKTVREASLEVDRGSLTFRLAAAEALRIDGQVIPMDVSPRGEGRIGLTRRFPVGPVLGITSFNAPLNVVAHKAAPAIAAGNPVVIKPSSRTPSAAMLLGSLIVEAGWPADAVSVLLCSSEHAEGMVADRRVRMVTFTGSTEVGWRLRSLARGKRITLELGGNAGVIVVSDANVPLACERIIWGAFSLAGQSCISVQRIYVDRLIWERFVERLVDRARLLRVGDPWSSETDVGPMIDEQAAQRADDWVAEAIAEGARALLGPRREGQYLWPTILTDVVPAMKVCSREVFAPVVAVQPFTELSEAVELVNGHEFGLQAGVFTRDLGTAFGLHERLDVGGVVVNDVPTFRIDHMPYGGVKDSGIGREGLRYAIEDMTELRLLLIDSPAD